MLVEDEVFEAENAKAAALGRALARGEPHNPIYLPAPHAVARALYTAFRTPPRLPSEPWLHQSLWHSIQVIFWGFLLSSILGVPLGILCGTFPALAKLQEPFIEFFRYLPAPAFGALAVAVLGIYDAPKVAIIFIGTFFQQVLVVANTTRKLELPLIEAAQTLGADNRQLVFKVVVPGVIVDLYTDMRILLGWAWTYLIVAEMVGTTSGITYFINQQARYRNYENVYAAIILIGLIGLASDVLLARLGRALFPWRPESRQSAARTLLRGLLPARARRAPTEGLPA
jgi:NitT/TauT family transport system permease protein